MEKAVNQDERSDGFNTFEWQCLTEAQREEEKPQQKAKQTQQKLCHLFQQSSKAVSQLYQSACQQQDLFLWPPLQAINTLYKESLRAQQQSLDLGFEAGHKRRNEELLAWVLQHHEPISREDLITILCGKKPSPKDAPPKMIAGSNPPGTSSRSITGQWTQWINKSHDGTLNCSSSISNTSQWTKWRNRSHGGDLNTSNSRSNTSQWTQWRHRSHDGTLNTSSRRSNTSQWTQWRNESHDGALNNIIAEKMVPHFSKNISQKRTLAQCSDLFTHSPAPKRSQLI
ncbi:HUWE1-associated protein modifying stress responses-like [Pelobates fuscus]|uniref:HUWE1-associated protein modifying stress responses-like n=1 Tax=Pelobates fuscus TaxID=191477 RepID=UPI002FE4A6FE